MLGLGINRLAAAQPRPPRYVAHGAHFGAGGGGLSGRLLQTEAADAFGATRKLTLSVWMRLPDAPAQQAAMHWGSTNLAVLGRLFGGYDIGFVVQNGSNVFSMNSAAAALSVGVWHHVFLSADTNFAAGYKTGYLYVDGVSVAHAASTGDDAPAFDLDSVTHGGIMPYAVNGADLELAELQFWLGVCVDPRQPRNLARLIRHGEPVAPAEATRAFGQQWFLCSGFSSDFAHNHGNGGALTASGTVVNAPNGPND